MTPKFDYEMLQQAIRLILEHLAKLLERGSHNNLGEGVSISIRYQSSTPNHSILVEIESLNADTQIAIWSAGTSDISAFRKPTGDSLYQFHGYIEGIGDVAPNINQIFTLLTKV